eukprot:CAMPEP_0196584050 /NCGR_PEP_ID=MMETSP1081-20130531/45581_1 /TAXON_ID=36882 /ORGANISM="Pyramimonas amylifera, Strain CCMP720" /LENGTH=429 /DNA_ID=CAMNT_0041905127 /DNA_START=247 /DNA_END=1536 /DNA_ORIENTATION=-
MGSKDHGSTSMWNSRLQLIGALWLGVTWFALVMRLPDSKQDETALQKRMTEGFAELQSEIAAERRELGELRQVISASGVNTEKQVAGLTSSLVQERDELAGLRHDAAKYFTETPAPPDPARLNKVPSHVFPPLPMPKDRSAESPDGLIVPEFSPPDVIAGSPRAFHYKGFLSASECDHLIALALVQLQRSTVVDVGNGGSVSSNIRTSSGMFLHKSQDEVVMRVEERIAAATKIPAVNGEGMQILRYEEGQKYDPHFDYFADKVNAAPQRGGQRMATFLMYLETTEQGGETVFPSAVRASDDLPDSSLSACAQRGKSVRPVKGDAVLFWDLHEDGKPDPHSLHGACPVIKGVKWSAPKWIRMGPFDGGLKEMPPMPKLSNKRHPKDCVDEYDFCPYWATNGECTKHTDYLMGSSKLDTSGYCMKSCGMC